MTTELTLLSDDDATHDALVKAFKRFPANRAISIQARSKRIHKTLRAPSREADSDCVVECPQA